MANIDPEDFRPTPPQTEDSGERGFVDRDDETGNPSSYIDLGQSELADDDDDVGDVADEGSGHRG